MRLDTLIKDNFPLSLTFHYLFNVKLHIKKERLSALFSIYVKVFGHCVNFLICRMSSVRFVCGWMKPPINGFTRQHWRFPVSSLTQIPSTRCLQLTWTFVNAWAWKSIRTLQYDLTPIPTVSLPGVSANSCFWRLTRLRSVSIALKNSSRPTPVAGPGENELNCHITDL